MSALETTNGYTPPRRNGRQISPVSLVEPPPATILEPIKPMTDDIAKDALRVSTLYGNAVKERNDFAAKLNEANARIQQFEIKVSEQRSTIESLTEDLTTERSERIRLAQVVEGIIHAAQRAIEQPGQNEQD